jgi:hypothetical protein
MKKSYAMIAATAGLLAFLVGDWIGSYRTVRADSFDGAQIDVRQIDGFSSLVVFYPGLNKVFVCRPFVSQPTWSCAFSIQLSTPGGTVDREETSR